MSSPSRIPDKCLVKTKNCEVEHYDSDPVVQIGKWHLVTDYMLRTKDSIMRPPWERPSLLFFDWPSVSNKHLCDHRSIRPRCYRPPAIYDHLKLTTTCNIWPPVPHDTLLQIICNIRPLCDLPPVLNEQDVWWWSCFAFRLCHSLVLR